MDRIFFVQAALTPSRSASDLEKDPRGPQRQGGTVQPAELVVLEKQIAVGAGTSLATLQGLRGLPSQQQQILEVRETNRGLERRSP